MSKLGLKLGLMMVSLGGLIASYAGAADSPQFSPSAQPSYATPRDEKIAMHQKLAKAHEDAVQCLKSDATLSECDDRLRAACPSGVLEKCVEISSAELERHRKTHEMGGIKGQEIPAQNQGVSPK